MAGSRGFATEEARKRHIQEEHINPREDPFKFVCDNLAISLGLDLDGHANLDAPQPVGTAMNPSSSKQGQTPGANSAATPMSRDLSMHRTGSHTGDKGPAAKVGSGKADKPLQTEATAGTGDNGASWATCIDPQSLFNLDSLVGNGVFNDMAVYRALTPNDTPESSKDSGASEPNSDISEGVGLDIDLEWYPAGADLLVDMSNFSMDGLETVTGSGADIDASLLTDAGFQQCNVPSWNEVTIDYSKNITFSPTLYHMDTT
jgi:hypothetical protein